MVFHDDDDIVTKFEFLKYMPGYIAVKDVNSRYCSISPGVLKLSGWCNISQSIYKTDYDFPSEASKAAPLFIDADKKVIEFKHAVTIIEIYHCTLGIIVLLDNKNPLINSQNNVIGVTFQCTDITSYFLKQYQWLYQLDHKFLGQIKTPQQYILTPEVSPLPISPRQQECLAWLVRGKGMKEIAFKMKINIRTVETHFDDIKHKLGCYNRSQLTEKAINSGFLFHIPANFLGINLTQNIQLGSISSKEG